MWTDLSSVLSQCTRATDRQTDRILIAIPHLYITCIAVKTNLHSAIKSEESEALDGGASWLQGRTQDRADGAKAPRPPE